MRTLQTSLRAFPELTPARRDASVVGERRAVRAISGLRGWLPPVLVGVSTVVVFVGTLSYQFLDWDDLTHIAWNPHYRGFTWTHLSWMVTTIRGGHWMPLTWATFGLDHALWSMDPFGYHLTNVLLHTANAIAFFAVAWSLLRRARPSASTAALQAGATGAALLFALHPLRAESVAWITERRDLLSALFWLVAVLCYVRAPDHAGRKAGPWKLLSVIGFMLAVMSKSIAVTLPVTLLLLDVYPLRRTNRGVLRLLLEKASYVPMMLFGIFMAVSGAYYTGYLTPVARLSPVERLLVAAYSAWFYVQATLVPSGLSPLYELPLKIEVADARFLVPALSVTAVTAFAFVVRQRWPALLGGWIAYLVTLSPVSGALHNGAQLVADRYSYLACLPLALLLGAGVSLIAGRLAALSTPVASRAAVAAGFAVLILALSGLTYRQLEIWRDSETLWRSAVAADPDCSICHFHAGKVFRGTPDVSIAHYERAAALRPSLTRTEPYLVNRGLTYVALDRGDAAERDLAALRSLSSRVANVLGPLFVTRW